MPSLLTKLENNEAVLLMYLANELPAEDRAEVDTLLERDETLRAQLNHIRSAYASLDSALGKADQVSPMPSGFAAARVVGDSIRRANERAGSVDEKEEAHPRHRQWVLYPMAAAAAIVIGMFLWWHNVADEMNKPNEIPVAYRSHGGRTIGEWEAVVNVNSNDGRPDSAAEIEQELQSVTYLSENLR